MGVHYLLVIFFICTAIDIIANEIIKIKLAFQVFNLDLFNIKPVMLILIIFLNNPVSST